MKQKRQLLIIVECLIRSDTSGKTIQALARETGIPASHVRMCISQYAELFVFPDAGTYVAINQNKVPRTFWRTYVVRRTKRDIKHNRVIWLGCGLAVLSAVFVSLVTINI